MAESAAVGALASALALGPHDWAAVERAVREQAPFHTAVVDQVLTGASFDRLRRELLADAGWGVLDMGARYQALSEQYLHNSRPPAPAVAALEAALRDALPGLLAELPLTSHWAILCRSNEGIPLHADHAAVVVNLWLTGDEHNLQPGQGGLLMSDVMRGPELTYPEYVNGELCGRYVAARTRGKRMRIPYRCNRAVIFDGRVMHATQPMRFSADTPETMRLNLSLAFGEP